jgi:hypothetical protein
MLDGERGIRVSSFGKLFNYLVYMEFIFEFSNKLLKGLFGALGDEFDGAVGEIFYITGEVELRGEAEGCSTKTNALDRTVKYDINL